MTHPNQLTTVLQVMTALGGVGGVAAVTGCEKKAVFNWKYFGHFPAHSYLAITSELKRQGKTAPDSLWRHMRKPARRNGTTKAKKSKAKAA